MLEFHRCLRSCLPVCAAAVALTSCSPGGSRDDESGFSGQTIELIVPFREGGGSDAYARTVAPFLQKHLAGAATVRVVNVLGASGIQGGNEFALRRDPDGLSMFISSGSNSLPFLLGERAVRYDFEDFAGILGSPTGGVVFASPSLGIDDLASVCTATGLVYGGVSPTGLDMVPLVAFELLGLQVQSILGYQGKGAARVAFERGEVTIDYQTTPAYLGGVTHLVDEGMAIPLFSLGQVDASGEIVRDPVFPDLPSPVEAFRTCRGEEPQGAGWAAYRAILVAGFSAQKNIWTHREAPTVRVEALRAAARATVADPDFHARTIELLGAYDFYTGDTVEVAFRRATQIDAAARAWLVAFLRDNHDVAL